MLHVTFGSKEENLQRFWSYMGIAANLGHVTKTIFIH